MNRSLDKIASLQANVEKVIRGKSEVIQFCIAAFLSKGHILLEDVPGVGKTTLAHALARSVSLSFQRIQFTSDLLPSDIVGVTIYNQEHQEFEFISGPIFTNVLLADEINRATPKSQSALLEAMSEGMISIEKRRLPLPDAIQNGQPQYRNLFYEDGGGFPVDASSLRQMQYCNLDPRDGSEFGLNASAGVLPSGETSCIISLRIYVDAAGNGWLEVYDYSLTDSIRSSG